MSSIINETPVNHIFIMDMNIEHPNGSDGWLPTELPQESDHRSSIKRKKVIRSRSGSTSRHSSQRDVDAPVEENMKNRAVSANNSLTPKQRSRIAKAEGQSEKISRSYLTPCNSKGWETHFQDHNRGRKNRETSCRYRYQRAQRTSKVSKDRCQGFSFSPPPCQLKWIKIASL